MPLSFGEYLRSLRIEAEMTLGFAARAVGVSIPYWSDVETGRRNPFKKVVLKKVVTLFEGRVNETMLYELAERARAKVSIPLERTSKRQADLVARFARVIEDLSDADVREVEAILRRSKDEGE